MSVNTTPLSLAECIDVDNFVLADRAEHALLSLVQLSRLDSCFSTVRGS